MKKWLVCTIETQGQRKNDFCWATDGNYLHFGMECDGESVDGKCGCRRAMCDVETAKATTTMKVVEIGNAELDNIKTRLIQHYMEDWKLEEARAIEFAKEEIKDVSAVASAFQVGSILEKRGSNFVKRN